MLPLPQFTGSALAPLLLREKAQYQKSQLRSQGRKRGDVALEEGGDGVGEDEADFTMGVNWGRGCWHVLTMKRAFRLE